eukprot:XP_019918297.1 PREDICTED: uncharacterized protein LOC105317197 [Crassostrea gigas]
MTISDAEVSPDHESTKDIRYEIRPMKRADLPSLYALLAENKWNMEMSYLECDFHTDPSGLTVVVKDNGELIRHCGFLAHSDIIACARMNIIKEEYRHLGIGKQMFREIMKVMGDRQIANTYVQLKSGRVVGYGVIRPSDVGYKMQPLYADDPKIAKALFCRLASHIPPGQVLNFIQPEGNDKT